MKIYLVISSLLLLSITANAFSELIPSDNFSVKYENSFWAKCNVVDPYNFQEAVLNNPQARDRVQNAKQALKDAYLFEKGQEFLTGGSPAAYSLAGFYCTAYEVDALRYGVQATSIIARQIDAELEKLEFEIGDNFTGSGSTELIDAKEAGNPRGAIGETIVKIQRNIAEAAWEIERNSGKAAGQTAIWLIQNNGAGHELEAFLKRIEKSQDDAKTLEQVSASELQEGVQQAQDNIDGLQQEDVEKLGEFELSQLELPSSQNGIEVDRTYATSPAGLLEESKRSLEKAKSIQRTAPLFTAKGRTANKINAYRNGLKSVALSKIASEKSLRNTLEVLQEVELNAKQETELAKSIDKPIGKSMALKLIASVKLGDTYFSKISNLHGLATSLHNLREVYSGKVDETEKLNLKIEVRNLQRMAKAAVVKGIAGASEIDASLADIYALINGVSDPGQLQQLEGQTSENRQILTGLIEAKFWPLRQTFNNAEVLAAEDSLTAQEEKKLDDVSEAFAGQGQLAEKISDVDQIQTTLNTIIESALKRKTTSLAGNSTVSTNITNTNYTAAYLAAAMAAITAQRQQNQTAVQMDANATAVDVQDLLKQLDEVTASGVDAFYTDGRTAKKTLEQLKFENSLKKAQAGAKDVAKNPSSQRISDLKAQINEMEGAIQEAQRKASVEIAIAEQRSNGTNADVEKAQQSWENGRYTDALVKAQSVNQQATLQGSAKLTGQVTGAGSSEEPKLWAIGASLVIILIGAAYLMYTKKHGEEQQPN